MKQGILPTIEGAELQVSEDLTSSTEAGLQAFQTKLVRDKNQVDLRHSNVHIKSPWKTWWG